MRQPTIVVGGITVLEAVVGFVAVNSPPEAYISPTPRLVTWAATLVVIVTENESSINFTS